MNKDSLQQNDKNQIKFESNLDDRTIINDQNIQLKRQIEPDISIKLIEIIQIDRKIDLENSKINSNEDLSLKNNKNNKKSMKSMCFLIQKYLEKPLLVSNRKFDIRCYVLLSQSNQVYIYE